MKICGLFGVASLCAAAALPALAAEQPLWELGLGAAALRLPHYRGSDQSRSWLLPVPYFVYRGELFKADREGARALLFESARVDLELSAAAGAPTNSEDNLARRGMDDLAPSIEIGPKLSWTVARGHDWTLQLRLPLRAALTLESRPRWIGWNASPGLALDLPRVAGSGFDLGLLAGPVYGSRRYHAYFYDVGAAEATIDRPAYRAGAGYGGAQFAAALSRRFASTWTGLFVRYDSVHGARFEASPLVRQRENLAFGIAFSWVLATSARSVPAPD